MSLNRMMVVNKHSHVSYIHCYWLKVSCTLWQVGTCLIEIIVSVWSLEDMYTIDYLAIDCLEFLACCIFLFKMMVVKHWHRLFTSIGEFLYLKHVWLKLWSLLWFGHFSWAQDELNCQIVKLDNLVVLTSYSIS